MNIPLKSFQSLWLKIQRRFGQYLKGSIQNPRWLLMFCVTRIHILRSLGIFLLKRPHSDLNNAIKNSLFNKLNPARIVENLQTDGLCLNIKLPEKTVREREDREIVDFYGKDKIEIICGKAGFGFVEDFYCFHKATVPKTKNRLMLEIEFAMNDYGLFYG